MDNHARDKYNHHVNLISGHANCPGPRAGPSAHFGAQHTLKDFSYISLPSPATFPKFRPLYAILYIFPTTVGPTHALMLLPSPMSSWSHELHVGHPRRISTMSLLAGCVADARWNTKCSMRMQRSIFNRMIWRALLEAWSRLMCTKF
jgi:hypothetical protein